MCWGSNVLSAVLDADYSTTGIGSTPGNSGILTPNAQTHAACLEWFKRASVWLDSHESRWRGVSDTEYWAPMLRGAIKKFYEQGESQVNEGEWFALVAFCRTDDAESAAPLLAQLIAEHHAWHDGRARVVLPLIEALELYAGPLRAERDRNPDLAEVKKDQHDALDWWQKNKNKRPVYWVLDALARRGYATSNPADVQTTANALVSALKKGERADRYLASRVMAYASRMATAFLLSSRTSASRIRGIRRLRRRLSTSCTSGCCAARCGGAYWSVTPIDGTVRRGGMNPTGVRGFGRIRFGGFGGDSGDCAKGRENGTGPILTR